MASQTDPRVGECVRRAFALGALRSRLAELPRSRQGDWACAQRSLVIFSPSGEEVKTGEYRSPHDFTISNLAASHRQLPLNPYVVLPSGLAYLKATYQRSASFSAADVAVASASEKSRPRESK
uniref:Uncharacterized protein n=1 Tax=Vespula pensylvanica TaxID=30213 RepID=A0A834P9A4_VESPE|nr:hypothetical protein H0235_005327 [Vespula pensylvanica]